MEVVHRVCCGIDVHKATLTACLRQVDGAGQVTKRRCASLLRPIVLS
jgi:hypothetical protein